MNTGLSVIEILRELVAIPTPPSVSNFPLLYWVAGYLERRGWRSELLPYEDEAGVAKANLIAWPSTQPIALDRDKNAGTYFDLAFVCHTDTVPYAKDWAEALVLKQRGNFLHGCGSCDVKGSLACFLAAIASVEGKTAAPGVALILTADEEIGCKGMERLLASRQLRIGSAIVSEPTSLRPGIAGKGYGLARITVTGREAHSAFPQQGVSAISVAARLIARIEDSLAGAASQTPLNPLLDSLFDPPQTTWNVGVIEGGTAKNIIAGRCSFLVEWRAFPGEDPAQIAERLKDLAAQCQAAEPRVTVAVEVLRAEPGFSPAAQGRLQNCLSGLLPSEPIGISFGSEASRLARIAEEVIVIGPGDMRTAHSDRECVPVDELEVWTGILRELIRNGISNGIKD